MAEIDLIEMKKAAELKCYRVWCASILMAWFPITISLTDVYQIPNIVSVPFLAGYLGFRLKKQVEGRDNFRQEIQAEIRKTDTYKMLAEEYQSYIGQLATFFQQQGITDSMEVNIFYQNLLNLGYLSYQNNYTYDFRKLSRNYSDFECMELEGARVIDGMAVCRHTSMMLKDLQDQLGNNCYRLNVFKRRNKLVRRILKYLNVTNHAINLLEAEDNSFYGYCSTDETFLNIKKEGKKLMISCVPSSRKNTTSLVLSRFQSEKDKWQTVMIENFKNEVRSIVEPTKNNSNVQPINSNMTCIYNKELNIKQLDPNEIMNLEQKIIQQTADSAKEIKEFYRKTKEQLCQIHSLNNSIVPLTNEKVKKLVIT